MIDMLYGQILCFINQLKQNKIMCLIPTHKECRQATTDIVCYKALKIDIKAITKKKKQILRSPYRNYAWSLNKLVVIRRKTNIRKYGFLSIDIGLHAYTDLYTARRTFSSSAVAIYKTIIPKGAWYKVDEDSKEIAATKMIIKSRCKNTQK